MESFSPVLEIVPELLSFLRGLEPAFDPHRLHIPCYHIVKEHELYLMMICLSAKNAWAVSSAMS